jgi:hypothetical protein
MNRFASRALALAAGIGCVAANAAAPSYVVIDTEQKAAAAVVTAHLTSSDTAYYQSLTIHPIQSYANLAVATAASVTSLSDLLANPAGIDVPCPTSGSMTATASPSAPRTLAFEWHDCHVSVLVEGQISLDGVGSVTLSADTFDAPSLVEIRFGDLAHDLVQTKVTSFPGFLNTKTNVRNLRVSGNIPVFPLQFVRPGAVTAYSFTITGFVDYTDQYEFPGTGDPGYEMGDRTVLESVNYTGSLGFNPEGTISDSDVTANGTLTHTRRLSPPYGTTFARFQYDGFRVHSIEDFGGSHLQTLTIDGRLNYTWPTGFGAGCLSGNYSFKTRSPLRGPLFAGWKYNSGELSINGAVKAAYFGPNNVPPGTTPPTQGSLLRNTLSDGSVFRYDIVDLLNTLRPVSGCM